LRGSQFSTLYSADIKDPEGPEQYNNTERKNGATFLVATLHFKPAVVQNKNLETNLSPKAFITTK
jgi:hypothetical protein